MPYIVRPKKVLRGITAAFAASALMIGAVPAMASAACHSNSTSQVFASFGDNARYFAAPGGTFESGASGWSLSDAEPINEEGRYGDSINHALKIHSGGSAVSPGFCVNGEYPSFRFMVRKAWGNGQLNVSLRYADHSGSHEASVGSVSTGDNFSLSPALALASNLPLAASSEGTINPVALVFGSDSNSAWVISDVYIDPYRR